MQSIGSSTTQQEWQHSNIFEDPADPEMMEYLSRRKESCNGKVVNVAQGMSIGPALYLWTHRLTSADVVSVVTTTRPSTSTSSPKTTTTTNSPSAGATGRAGLMNSTDNRGADGQGGIQRAPSHSGSFNQLKGAINPAYSTPDKWVLLREGDSEKGGLTALRGGKADVEKKKLVEKERLRSPLELPLFTSPLEGNASGIPKYQERMGRCLLAERERFMGLLGRERQERLQLEEFACSLIQATFRGYQLRQRWAEIEARQRIKLRVRKRLREFLTERRAPFALGRLEQQLNKDGARKVAAMHIQLSFRSFLARQTLGKRRSAAFLLRRRRAARTLQCWSRVIFAIRRLRYDRMRAKADIQSRSAVVIQRQYRRMLGARITRHRRRVLHSTTASMIQGRWRLHKATEAIREVTLSRLFRSATAIQRIARGYVARRKVGRQLVRVRALRKTRAVYTLQKFIRRAQARRRIWRLRMRRLRGTHARAALHVQRACRGFVGRKRAATLRKTAFLDIWRAAREGNSSRVDALYYGQGLGGVIFDCINNRDTEGNTLLAKVVGGVCPVPLVKVVLKWGSDVNAINDRGQSPLRLAMMQRHLEVVDLLVNHADIQLEQDKPGKSLLHEAAAFGLHHLTAQLVSKGLDVNGVDPVNGWTPVHYACHNGRDELARLLTSRSGTALDLSAAGGLTPLHLAAAGGWDKCAANLLENEASPDVRNDKGQAPPVVAMLNGHESTAKKLLRAFSTAKITPKRSQVIIAQAAAALKSGVSSNKGNGSKAVVEDATVPGQDNSVPSNDGGGLGVGTSEGRGRSSSIASTAASLDGTTIKVLGGDDPDTMLSAPVISASILAPAGLGDGGAAETARSGPRHRTRKASQFGMATTAEAGEGRTDSEAQPRGSAPTTSQDEIPASPIVDASISDTDATQEPDEACANLMRPAVLSRRASKAGVAVDLDGDMLEQLVPQRWDDDDLRAAVSLAYTGEVWCLASLFALGLDPLCRHPDTGDTLGIAAAKGGHREVLEICLETGVCFAAKNTHGRTALHAAAMREDLEVAALLLVNPDLSGVDAENLCDPDEAGRTPLHEMAARGHAPTVLLLAAEPESDIASSTGGGRTLDGYPSGEDGAGCGGAGDVGGGVGMSAASSSSPSGIGPVGGEGSHDGENDLIADSRDDDTDAGGEASGGDDGLGASDAGVERATTAECAPGPNVEDNKAKRCGGDGRGGDAVVSTASVHSLIRYPRPLSEIPAPSLADTPERQYCSPKDRPDNSGDRAGEAVTEVLHDSNDCSFSGGGGGIADVGLTSDAIETSTLEARPRGSCSNSSDGRNSRRRQSLRRNSLQLPTKRTSLKSRSSYSRSSVRRSSVSRSSHGRRASFVSATSGDAWGSVADSTNNAAERHDKVTRRGGSIDDCHGRIASDTTGDRRNSDDKPVTTVTGGGSGDGDRNDGDWDTPHHGDEENTIYDEGSAWGGLLDVDVRCSGSGSCPLHEAAASGSVGAVLSLVDLGADVLMANYRGDTALHVAVGPEAPRDPDDEGRSSISAISPLNDAIEAAVDGIFVECDEEGRGPTTQVVTALLRHGADPSAKDGSGRTAAMGAVLSGRPGALRELQGGALQQRRRPRMSNQQWEQDQRTRDEQEEMSELARVAISEGHVACLRVLVDLCSEQDKVLAWADDDGAPVVGLAVAFGGRECVDILLAGATPPNLCGRPEDANTVLHAIAVAGGSGGVPVLKRLISNKGGGEPFESSWLELRNRMGDTVLMAALRAGRHSAASLLLQASAVPTAAAHTFRYAWVIAAALRSAALCPCSSCVLGRSAEERARLCSKSAMRTVRPWERTGGLGSGPTIYSTTTASSATPTAGSSVPLRNSARQRSTSVYEATAGAVPKHALPHNFSRAL